VQPTRTCVGCRAKAPKADLLRVVRTSRGVVMVDPTGSASGRGAYLHRDATCAETAMAAGSLARALRTGPAQVELGRLRNEIHEQIGAH
jgi:uncharacterized protein